jgi:molecular chaperone GrpE
MSKQHEKKRQPETVNTENATADERAATQEQAAGASETQAPNADDQKSESGKPDAAIELKARIASLEAETSNLKDQYLRKAAEFENFRKRMNKEKQDAIDFANQSLLLDLVPVIDDLERAISPPRLPGTTASCTRESPL